MRLIDANDAVVNFGFEYDDIAPTPEEFIAFLKRQSTVDAEVVTHCKDCKYYDIQPDGRVMNWCKRRGFAMYDEDFCSRAEPKEDK